MAGETAQEFLDALGMLQAPGEIHLASIPADNQPNTAQWFGYRLISPPANLNALSPEANHYFSIATMLPETRGRSDRNIAQHSLIVLDDVGTKVPLEKVDQELTAKGINPTAVVETSPGNYSWFFALAVPVDPRNSHPARLAILEAVRQAIKILGLSDPAVQDASRYMRLPAGVNSKEKNKNPDGTFWRPRVTQLHPGRAYSLYAWGNVLLRDRLGVIEYDKLAKAGTLADTMNAMLATVPGLGPTSRAGIGVSARNASMNDPMVLLAAKIGLDPKPSSRTGVIEAHCPNEIDHSDGDLSGFAFIREGKCKCQHAHCQHLTSDKMLEMMCETYDEDIRLGLALGKYVELSPGGAVTDATTHEIIPRSGRSFLAAAAFLGPENSRSGGLSLSSGELNDKNSDLSSPRPASNPEDVFNQAEAMAARDAAKAQERTQMVAALRGRFVSIPLIEGFYDMKEHRLTTAGSLENDQDVLRVFKKGPSGEKRASNRLLNMGLKQVSGIAKVPGAGLFVQQPDDAGVMRECVNLFRGTTLLPWGVGGIAGLPMAWLTLVEYVIPVPAEREYFLSVLAYRVQNPDKPMPVIMGILGQPGIGKDVMLKPLYAVFGEHNCEAINADRLLGEFNEVLTNQFIVLSEFKSTPAIYARLKDLTGDASPRVAINPKYGKPYKLKINPMFYFTANDPDALHGMTLEDRRFFPIKSSAVRDTRGRGSVTKPGSNAWVAHWVPQVLERDEASRVFRFLLDRDWTCDYQPGEAPPFTSGRQEIIEDSLSPAAAWVYDQVRWGRYSSREVLVTNEIMDAASSAVQARVRTGMSPSALRAGLEAAGSVALGRVRSGKNERVRVWLGVGENMTDARRRELQSMTSEELRTIMATEKAALERQENTEIEGLLTRTNGQK